MRRVRLVSWTRSAGQHLVVNRIDFTRSTYGRKIPCKFPVVYREPRFHSPAGCTCGNASFPFWPNEPESRNCDGDLAKRTQGMETGVEQPQAAWSALLVISSLLVDFVPVQAKAGELDPRALCRARKQKARKRCERDAERAAIAQLNPHRVLVKVHRHGRKVHASPVSCTPWCCRRCRI